MKSSLRIIITGLVGLYPVGGVAWDYLQYLLGLERLGHDVYYYEDTWSWPYHPVEGQVTGEADYSVRFLAAFFARYAPQLASHWHYVHLHDASHGMERAEFDRVARSADLFINVSGAGLFPDALSPRCLKVFLDTDPGYNQIMLSERFAWSENVGRWCESVAAHDRHFTYAENIDGPDCLVPKLGFAWQTTRMPMCLDAWRPLANVPVAAGAPWTTVMTWNAFKGRLIYRGVEYKSKGSEFEKLMDLPQRVAAPFQVAVGGIGAPLDRLATAGWDVVDGPATSLTPEHYQRFIAASRGEVSAAKHVYVAMRTGWFSCRSACYLASGRPVVVQDTGCSRVLPVGRGLMTFATADEAAAAIEVVEADYQAHARAAVEFAAVHLDAGRVLTEMITKIFASPPQHRLIPLEECSPR
jgi:hypothetical protein